jgi:hypothetical protein
MWRRLEWLCAVAQLIRRHPALDWTALLEKADRLGARRILGTGLRLAHELLSSPLPPEMIRQVLTDPAVAKLADGAQRRLFSESRASAGIWASTCFRLSSRERWRDRWRYCGLRLITPTHRDLRSVTLPGSLFWLYYLLRPIRLIMPGFFAAASRARRRTAVSIQA